MINYTQILEHITEILDELGLSYHEFPNRISMPCPIHSGHKRDGCCVFTDGDWGNWKCWTHHCEKNYEPNIVGFINGILENQLQKKFDKNSTIEWIEKFTKKTFKSANPVDWQEKRETINISKILAKTNKPQTGIDRHLVRQSLKIPSQYFISRGFLPETLQRYDVGLCVNSGKQMFQRVVVPVYNDEHTQMIGCVGRTLNNKCLICNKYHSNHEQCPSSSFEEYCSSKWINSKGFNAENYLYNYWFAKDNIKLSQTVILVEGQGDVWALEEAGITIGLGIFGTSLTDHQLIKLESTGAINVLLATDNDPPGIEARYKIQEQLERSYNIIPVILKEKDVGEMSREQIKETFQPILSKLIRNNECKIF